MTEAPLLTRYVRKEPPRPPFWRRHGLKIAAAAAPVLLLTLATILGASLSLPLGQPNPAHNDPKMTWLRGAYGVPTLGPEGDDQRGEILAAAVDADLDFIVTVDKDRARASSSPAPSLTVLPAAERDVGPGNLLFLGDDALADPALFPGDRQTRRPFAVASHPNTLDVDWDLRALDPTMSANIDARIADSFERFGLDILNARQQPQDERVFPFLAYAWASWMWLFNERHALLLFYDRPQEIIALWDNMSKPADLPIVGLCAADTSALGLPHPLTLDAIGTYVVLDAPPPDNPDARRRAILDAITRGNTYCALDLLARAQGFSFTATITGQKHQMGSRLDLDGEALFEIVAPEIPGVDARISLFRDGTLHALRAGRRASVTVSTPGVYRVEVDLNVDKPASGDTWITWLYSNPIILTRPSQDRAAP